ncbi:TIGR03084 family metal-binding protein [Parasedimentitalea maritima]|uniref:TIGR03084 family protein n=1 Tax=Parasedimentitalea maritima TaxID=2578117 RepID=A0A6A4RB90_9RHOB|nr:TIGR03084 family metal-binding protein [Zongyanglinia marina]KAE9625944.1 TIGR03084 family protein [Zongyanglinia marina]
MQQAEDFRAESVALAGILESLPEAEFFRPTLFKSWTIDHILGHLHLFNMAAEASLKGEETFAEFIDPVITDMQMGKSILECQFPWLEGMSGRALYEAWREGAENCADSFAQADPKLRVKWIGPDMSALSSITARQMETWAHGQAVFDLLGLERKEQDSIRNIAHLGVATFSWTFRNRKEEVPNPAPYVELTGPSGAVWQWNEPQKDNAVRGKASEFAQVVTQTRSVADTSLQVTGNTACSWMEQAQCFAGPPETPPSMGQRYKME